MNTPRLAARNRKHWKDGAALIERIAEDGRIDGHELGELLEWQSGGAALGAVIDLNDSRGRAVSLPQVRSLDQEYQSWLPRLPET